MRRFIVWATALGMFAGTLPVYAADEPKKEEEKTEEKAEAKAEKPKRSRKKKARGHSGRGHGHVTVAQANSPFADVPRDHWAYEAVAKSVESGLLQGFNNKFCGSRAMTRYQMAVVVARMLEKVAVLKANGRMFTAQDIANLEALTVEFADELALLNVKVSNIEQNVDVLRKQVDELKYDLEAGGPRSPITGLVSSRYVVTSSGAPGYGQAAGSFPASAATPQLLRYRGDVTGPGLITGAAAGTGPGTAGNPFLYDDRSFSTISQFSLNLDRQVLKDVEFHTQIDINAEAGDDVAAAGGPGVTFDPATGTATRQNGTPGNPFRTGSGRGSSFLGGVPIHVNELYVQMNDAIGDADAKAGVFATPFNTEVNGPSRTYNWTITPSAMNTQWESLRPTGVEFRNGRKEDYWLWNVGMFSNLDSQNGASGGTLLSGIQGAAAGGPTDPFGGVTGGINGRRPTPRLDVMSDAPAGVNGQTESESIGWYARIGGVKKDNLGFGWQLGFIDNGGDLRPTGASRGTLADFNAWHAEADYKWKKWMVLGQFYGARTKNLSTLELDPTIAGFNSRRVGTGSPFPNLGRTDTDTDAGMGLITYAWNKQSSVTARYEAATDTTGNARIEGDFWTFGYNRKITDKSTLQFEYITADSETVSDNLTANSTDINDDLLQVNYRLQF